MSAAGKTILLLLLAYSGWAAETRGKYYSDQEYKELRSYTAPSNFYPDGNSGQLQLLIMCIDRGDVPVLDELLNGVPNFSNVTEHGSRCSPVHWAAFKGDTNVLRVLSKHKADFKKKGTNWDIAALHIARNAAAAEFLLQHGAELESKDVHGQTPLMWAAKRGNLEVVQCLLAHGAEVNTRDERDRTALLLASASGFTNIVELLIKKGAIPQTTPGKENPVYDMTVGIFSGAGAEHPFAESTLIYGKPAEWRPLPLNKVDNTSNGLSR
jgi:ankyrin repeat protein